MNKKSKKAMITDTLQQCTVSVRGIVYEVYYEEAPYRAATREQPEEGGIEIKKIFTEDNLYEAFGNFPTFEEIEEAAGEWIRDNK
jgi:hypothetical protein